MKPTRRIQLLFRSLRDSALRKVRRFLYLHSTPYFHLRHMSGELYMERFWLLPRFMLRRVEGQETEWEPKPWVERWLPVVPRLHHILDADLDRALHDHPWGFVSWVLEGAYIEERPINPLLPLFDDHHSEFTTLTRRGTGSLARRRALDRHRIAAIAGDVWTVVFLSRRQQWWGFYLQEGKIYWRHYRGVPLDQLERKHR